MKLVTTKKDWMYNEFVQLGTDYNKPARINEYDEKMKKLRDIDKEAKDIFHCIDIKPGHRLLEVGCGTGEFTIRAAKKCSQIVALDTSASMIEYAQQKAIYQEVYNIVFVNKGFLTYKHTGRPFDAIISSLVLHHLPDFWKLIALKRMYDMLNDGGVFYLMDVIYTFDHDEYADTFDRWLDRADSREVERGIRQHISQEFSTTRWIMEHLIKESGFAIERIEFLNDMLTTYVCRKKIKGDGIAAKGS